MRSAARVLLLAVVALLVAGVAATEWQAGRREARAIAEFPPEGRIVEVDGRRVHAVTRGSGPDLVLIHGASGNSRDFTWRFVGLLTDRYRVTAFDRPGQGYTDRAAPGLDGPFATRGESPAEQADLLRAAAAQLGIERPIVLGHSYGGSVAMAWALADPEGVAAVVDVSGATMPWPGSLNGLYRANASGLGGALFPPLISAWAPERFVEAAVEGTFAPQAAPEGYADHLGTALAIRRSQFRANARQVNVLRPHLVEMSARYAALPMPLEIVHGDADTIVPAEVHSVPLSRLVPGANLTILPGIGHMPHQVAADAVVAAIDRARRRAGL